MYNRQKSGRGIENDMNQEMLPDRRKALLFNAAFYTSAAVLLVILCLFCFYRLGDRAIYDADEARHGASAYEMIQSGEWIITTYKGTPDYWNLKPPLSEWAICTFFAIFGYTKASFRAYSAVSMFLCVVLLFVWSWRRSGKAGSLFTLLAMLAINPLWMFHCARAGDANALFLLFCTISTICLAEAFDRNPKYLILSCFSASMAFLTKSFHAVILVVEMFASLFILHKQIRISKSLVLYSIAALVLPTGIWALLRYRCDGTAFLSEMLFTDVLHRSATTIEGHIGGPAFYVDFLLSDLGVLACMAAIPAGVLLLKKLSSHHIILALSIFVPLLVFSAAKTKIEWYIYSAFPAISLLAGDGIQRVIDSQHRSFNKWLAVSIPVFVALLATYHSAYGILISPVVPDPVQEALEICLDRTDETHSHTIYLDLRDNEKESWSASRYLTIQLAGDCLPGDGSIEDWKNDTDALLFTTDDSSSASEGKIIRSFEGYCLLSH